MYSTSNLFHRHAFIQQEIGQDFLSFPLEIDQSYSAVIDWLYTLEGMADFDRQRSVRLDSKEWVDTGRQFSQFLPSHAMKVYQTLLQLESTALDSKTSTSPKKF